MQTLNGGPNIKFSCYMCTERKPGCHSSCERYHNDKAAYEELKDAERKEHIVDTYMDNLRENLHTIEARSIMESDRRMRSKYK